MSCCAGTTSADGDPAVVRVRSFIAVIVANGPAMQGELGCAVDAIPDSHGRPALARMHRTLDVLNEFYGRGWHASGPPGGREWTCKGGRAWPRRRCAPRISMDGRPWRTGLGFKSSMAEGGKLWSTRRTCPSFSRVGEAFRRRAGTPQIQHSHKSRKCCSLLKDQLIIALAGTEDETVAFVTLKP